MSTFNPSVFTAPKPRPLPIILMLDSSGSMSGPKIQSLNIAVRKMIGTLLKEESNQNEFMLSVITFGETARLLHRPTSAASFVYKDLQAGGGTPLGSAIELAKSVIEDRQLTPSRVFRPLVVLVSDGVPTDSWEKKLEDFVKNGRSAKCDRMALAIGPEAVTGTGRRTLETFVAGTEHKVFEANDADEIPKFFRFVTMSVVSRSLSADPDQIPADEDLNPPVRENSDQKQKEDDEESYW